MMEDEEEGGCSLQPGPKYLCWFPAKSHPFTQGPFFSHLAAHYPRQAQQYKKIKAFSKINFHFKTEQVLVQTF